MSIIEIHAPGRMRRVTPRCDQMRDHRRRLARGRGQPHVRQRALDLEEHHAETIALSCAPAERDEWCNKGDPLFPEHKPLSFLMVLPATAPSALP
jgi:hypothetical protein